ncbi:MAG: ABC transporter ATP-binding protein [Oscillospiraceae bacterium]|nr:ABC transporter ATP-binding protein [Oscillospiraceae bacterium]MDD4368189.1 ABC transporter ATP-binding protein [Oscillospiraceae bacterium]
MKQKVSPLTVLIYRTLAHHRALTGAAGLIILTSVLTALLPPLALEQAVDQLAAGHGLTLRLPVLYFALLALADLLEAGQNVMITILGQKITHALRSALGAKLSRLASEYYTRHAPAEITSRFVNDVDTVDDLFTTGIVSMFADALQVLSILLMIFYKSLGLGLLMLVVTPALFILTRQFQQRMLQAQLDNRIAVSRVSQHIPETLHNLRTIRTLGRQAFMQQKYDYYIQACYHAQERSNFYDSVYSPVVIFTSAAVTAVMMLLAASGSRMQSLFGLSIGSAVAVMAYVSKVFSPLESIGMEIQNIQSAVAGVRRINEFLGEAERPVMNPVQSGPLFATVPARLPVIQFKAVYFSYDRHSNVLQDFNLSIYQGEAVTITGRTGAGKSTLFRLILGLYPPQRGQVLINGQDACQLPDQLRRRLFGIVTQDFQAVAGTIAEQISLFDPALSQEQLIRASQLVELDESIKRLPLGYQTPFSQAAFSQGQLQLLSIARAVAAEPAILLLDETAANLDSETERQLMQALMRASQGRTVLSIAHRRNLALPQLRQISLDGSQSTVI